MPAPSSRAARRDTIPRQASALDDFHTLAGHPGPADGCQDCAAQLDRQRHAAAALRAHQRQARQQAERILTSRTQVADLHKGDTVQFEDTRYTVVRNIRESSGFHTLQLQVPGTPVRTLRQSDPGFTFTRIIEAGQ